jgi:hypothetical protein
MTTTLHTHPPQPRPASAELPRLTSRRPTPLERLALRLGLLLITYGRRRYAATRDDLATLAERRDRQRERELRWERQRLLLLPPR